MIRERRREMDLTQQQVHARGGPCIHAQSRLEAGQTKRPRREVLQTLAKVLGLDYRVLMHTAGFRRFDEAGEELVSISMTRDEAVEVAEYLAFIRFREVGR